jgi:glycosyltransferase XagB
MEQRSAKTVSKSAETAGISVVIPTLNEVDNVHALAARLSHALAGRKYELIFIDDHSTDGTFERLQELVTLYPAAVYLKQGKTGKAFSLVQGFQHARYDYVAMIDADLQYPPESIPVMVQMIDSEGVDLVVGNRKATHANRFRTVLSYAFRTFFGRMLWGMDVDIQSGLKVFRREIIDCLTLHPAAPWTFDLEFLLCARSGGFELAGHTVRFTERVAGRSKVRWLSTGGQLIFSALNLRLSPPYHIPFIDRIREKEGHGFYFRSQKYITHTTLAFKDMAVQRTSLPQRLTIMTLLVILVLALLVNWHATLIGLVTLVTILYASDLLFNLYLIVGSFYSDREVRIEQSELSRKREWPRYTIFCPLYHESAVISQFIQAISDIEYPRNKLEVLLLLEEDDEETIQDIRAMALPNHFKIVIVPHSLPKTKPKACNYGLSRATGEYVVIYDAEDIPDPQQLKKAVIAFARADEQVGCIQAKLNYYNTYQNILTRLFTLEYSLWFNLILTGLQSIDALIPLGGTSNHFRIKDLRKFEGWDPFNVTEDADLGVRLAKRGFRTAIIDSVTMEEANSELANWMKQRSRWIKGYIQTYLVHMRSPKHLLQYRKSHLPILHLVIGGKVLSLFINPLLWAMTLAYIFVPAAREFIRSLYLTPVLYIGITALVFGNFLYVYYYMLGVLKQERAELVVYALLVPVYWLMMSLAAFYALSELILRPHHWHKTKHGLHLKAKTTAAPALQPEVT